MVSKGKIKKSGEAIAFANQLAETANLYAAMLNSDADFWATKGVAVRKNVAALVTFKAERIRPLMLACMRKFTDKELALAIRLFVSWSVRLMIAGGPAGTIEDKVGDMAKKVTSFEIKTSKQLASEIGAAVPSDVEFEAAFLMAKVSRGPLARYYLRTMENTLKGDTSVGLLDDDESKVNLEHVLPQNPDAEWGHSSPKGRAIVQENFRRLGNLALMRKKLNEEIGNQTFLKKLPFYKAEKEIQLTHSLAEYSEWGPHQIHERQAKLAKLAVTAWPLHPK